MKTMSAIHDEQKMLFEIEEMSTCMLHKLHVYFSLVFLSSDKKNNILENLILCMRAEIINRLRPLKSLKIFAHETVEIPQTVIMSTPPQTNGTFSRLYNAY